MIIPKNCSHFSDVDEELEQFRVRLVDLGIFRTAKVSNIGCLQEHHQQFPLQSTSLCLLNVVPYGGCQWGKEETAYVTQILLGRCSDETFGKNSYESFIQWEIQPDLVFALNLFTLTNGPMNQHGNFIDHLIQKGIARVDEEHSNEFFHHAVEQNILTASQLRDIKQSNQHRVRNNKSNN